MANRLRNQFLYSRQPKLTLMNGAITIGASGAVTSQVGALSCTKLATGVYELKLPDTYYAALGANFEMEDPASGSAVTAGSFSVGTLYQITTLGTTNWATAGADADYAPSVGQPFVATAAGSGTGTATPILSSNIISISSAQSIQSTLSNVNVAQGKGSAVILMTYGLPASGQVPALTSPLSGSIISFKLWFRDSSAAISSN